MILKGDGVESFSTILRLDLKKEMVNYDKMNDLDQLCRIIFSHKEHEYQPHN